MRPSARGVLLALAAAFPVAYLAVALLRMAYPFELEWIEGMALIEAGRVLHGAPLYVAPSLDYVPLNYAPLYFWGGALAMRALGESFLALRLVSILASIGCLALVYGLVWRETRNRVASALAACLYAATYRLSGAWFDIARGDSLYLLALLAALAALRRERPSVRRALLAGTLLALAFLTKQSAIAAIAPFLAYLAWRRRPDALGICAGLALVGGGVVLALHLFSSGWSSYYMFEIARAHRPDPGLIHVFWTQDVAGKLAGAAGIAAFALFARDPRGGRAFPPVLGAGLIGLVVSSWWLRTYRGGFDNVLMPAHAALAIAFGIGWHALGQWAAGLAPEPGRVALRFASVAAILQFALLLYDPTAQIPRAADRLAGADLLEGIRRAPGEVLIPCHSYLAARAGHATHLHEVPFMDVVRFRSGPRERALLDSLRQALRQQRYAAIVLDNRDWLWDEAGPYYEARWPVSQSDRVLWPVTGMRTRPESVLLPRKEFAPGAAARRDSASAPAGGER